MTITEIRAVLSTRGLRPLKQLGQNFLHDRNLAVWLADQALAGAALGEDIVEIGPGLGSLTSQLLARGGRVIALEKDRGLTEFLRERFSAEITANKLDLQHGDALQLLPALRARAICGNLPYYISTPLLMECLKLEAERLFFVVQKEVGQRLASEPGGKIYGALSVLGTGDVRSLDSPHAARLRFSFRFTGGRLGSGPADSQEENSSVCISGRARAVSRRSFGEAFRNDARSSRICCQ